MWPNSQQLHWTEDDRALYSVCVCAYIRDILIQRAVHLWECATSVFPSCDAWHRNAVKLVMAVPLVTTLIVRTETERVGWSQVLVKWPKLWESSGRKESLLCVFFFFFFCMQATRAYGPITPIRKHFSGRAIWQGVKMRTSAERELMPVGSQSSCHIQRLTLVNCESMVSSGCCLVSIELACTRASTVATTLWSSSVAFNNNIFIKSVSIHFKRLFKDIKHAGTESSYSMYSRSREPFGLYDPWLVYIMALAWQQHC